MTVMASGRSDGAFCCGISTRFMQPWKVACSSFFAYTPSNIHELTSSAVDTHCLCFQQSLNIHCNTCILIHPITRRRTVWVELLALRIALCLVPMPRKPTSCFPTQFSAPYRIFATNFTKNRSHYNKRFTVRIGQRNGHIWPCLGLD